jgi:hypothetical protein
MQTKVVAVLLAGAITTIFLWLLKAFGQVEVPGEVGGAITTVLSTLIGWLVPQSKEEVVQLAMDKGLSVKGPIVALIAGLFLTSCAMFSSPASDPNDPLASYKEQFRLGCFSAAMADGLFKGAAPALVVYGVLTQEAVDIERVDYTELEKVCANPPTTREGLVSFASQLVGWGAAIAVQISKAQAEVVK